MRSPALAIAWEFGRRHRWGFAALAAYLLILATTDLLIVDPGQAVNVDGYRLPAIAPRFAATVIVPVSIFTYYFLAVFSFGLAGDLAARQSMYPARAFTLPVTTAALAGWPMLYGTATLAGLWMATTRFAVWPSGGVDVPLLWPALFVAASLAWTQALMWLSYGLPGLRVIVSVLWLPTIYAVVFTAVDRKVPESLMVAALAPQVPLAYLCARFAVAVARRGDVPDWRAKFTRLGRIANVLPRRRDRFPSAARAQLWFEWRLQGRSLPVWVAILLPFELALLFVAGDAPSLVAYTLAGVLLTPPLMAAFAAPRVRKSSPHVSDAYAMTPFLATRPVTSAALIAAKLKMAIRSTLAAWLLVLVAIPTALTLSGTWPVVIERARQVSDAIGSPRAVAIGILGFSGLVTWTWKQLMQSLYVGLSGREWLVRLSTCLTLTVLIFIEPIVHWIRESSDVRIALWNAMPWILAALVSVKMSAASWIAPRLQSSGLLSDRALVTGAACWVAAVLALYAVLAWLVSGPLIPHYLLLLLAILGIPLARLSAAPLALAWNRHR
ncbi:MAG: hypothetical protein HY704_12930 [Gemmatimonadetes bacterium]|nr:hypothetical protein [Gemmatimonadota bacterium]